MLKVSFSMGVCQCSCVCTYMWKAEANSGVLPRGPHTLLLETETLSDLKLKQ